MSGHQSNSSEKVQFTPGPWRRTGRATIRHGDGVSAGWIADVHWKNREANARLIAAAPDLLEACQLAANVLFLLKDEVAALGLHAKNVPEKVRTAIQRATT